MRWITARRRHPAAGYAVVLLMLVALGGGYAFLTGSGAAAAPVSGPSSASIAKGADLFARNCATCHGLSAEGTSDGEIEDMCRKLLANTVIENFRIERLETAQA